MSEPVRARKSLGQNFLVDANIQRKIVAALEPQPKDTVVEIGPGLGALTVHLLGNVAHLIVIELDDRLAQQLETAHGARADFRLVHDNVLNVDFTKLGLPDNYKIIGNIPYNITTPLLFKLLEPGLRPALLVVMVQKEVAQRVTATPGHKEYGALSVGVQSVARAERLFTVGRGSFRPAPNVDSAILRITPLSPAPLTRSEEDDLRALTRTLFGQRRKQMQTILRKAPEYLLDPRQIEWAASAVGVHPSCRPEELSPLQFIELARLLRNVDRPTGRAA
jgi:16S rRNA (adenine1518-N6/adenine1519-N6)-dimethyltransferase